MSRNYAAAAPIAAVYLGSIIVANYVTTHYGFVPVGFGEVATAGTFAAGAALVVRDLLQDTVGRVGVALLILVGAGLSWFVSAPFIALASGLAFLTSETLDMVVYTPLRRRGRFGGYWWQAAVLAGAVIGAIVDSVVFLGIAFGRAAIAPALPGQLIGKLEVAVALLIVGAVTGAVFREPVNAEGA